MRCMCIVALHLLLLLIAFKANGVPTRPHHEIDIPELYAMKAVHVARMGPISQQTGARFLKEDGDALDRILQAKMKKSTKSKSKQDPKVPNSEVAELWKYIAKRHSRTSRQQNGADHSEEKFEVLLPLLPPHIFLVPSGTILPATPEPEEAELESSPELDEYPFPSPSLVPEYEVIYPSYTPGPDNGSRKTFPSLANVDNETGEIIYRPWNSLYVTLRHLFKKDSFEEKN